LEFCRSVNFNAGKITQPVLPDIFKPKILIGVYIRGPWNGKCWYILGPFGTFDSHLVFLMAIWYNCGYLVYFFWYDVPRKIWQP
jgi:hypothetical protein